MRGIKEAITIRREQENMNSDEGRYTLSHLYDDLLNTGNRDFAYQPSQVGGGDVTTVCCHSTT